VADLQEVTPHIYLLKLMNATRTNIYIVREPDGDTLVDPGPVGTAPAILALDRRGEIRLRRMILTHAHPAHAGSAARVARGTGVRIYVHPLDMCYLDGREPPLLPPGRRGQLVAALGRVVDLCPAVFRLDPLVDKVGSLEPIPTPGHSPGHVCLLHREDAALLSGDARPPDVPYRHLLPGHGAPTER
jgi:glyoxylase-like metal-dependent hydrolase (beta-lactamase superfamily II)